MSCREVKSVQKTLTQLQLERNKRDSKLYMNMFSKYVVTDSSVANKVGTANSEHFYEYIIWFMDLG